MESRDLTPEAYKMNEFRSTYNKFYFPKDMASQAGPKNKTKLAKNSSLRDIAPVKNRFSNEDIHMAHENIDK